MVNALKQSHMLLQTGKKNKPYPCAEYWLKHVELDKAWRLSFKNATKEHMKRLMPSQPQISEFPWIWPLT